MYFQRGHNSIHYRLRHTHRPGRLIPDSVVRDRLSAKLSRMMFRTDYAPGRQDTLAYLT